MGGSEGGLAKKNTSNLISRMPILVREHSHGLQEADTGGR